MVRQGLLFCLFASVLCVPALAQSGSEESTGQSESAPAEESQTRPENGESIPEIVKERHTSTASSAEAQFPDVPGCAPLQGDPDDLPAADQAHRFISQSLCRPVDELNESIADIEEVPVPGADSESRDTRTEPDPAPPVAPESGTVLLRLSTSLDWQARQPIQPGADISASFRLSSLYRRINRIQRQTADAMDLEQLDPSDPRYWALAPAIIAVENTDIGLNGWHPFVRFRLNLERTWRNGVRHRLRPELFWRWDDGYGAAGAWRLSYPTSGDGEWALNNEFELSEASHRSGDGTEWAQELTYQHHLAESFVITGRLAHRGDSEPVWRAEERRTDVRIRRSLWRPWLITELEPYLLWERETGWDTTPGVFLRLQVEFGNYELYDD